MIVGYIYILLKRNTKASKDLQDYKPNDANRITTIHRPSLTSVIDKRKKQNKSLIGLVPYWAIAQP